MSKGLLPSCRLWKAESELCVSGRLPSIFKNHPRHSEALAHMLSPKVYPLQMPQSHLLSGDQGPCTNVGKLSGGAVHTRLEGLLP